MLAERDITYPTLKTDLGNASVVIIKNFNNCAAFAAFFVCRSWLISSVLLFTKSRTVIYKIREGEMYFGEDNNGLSGHSKSGGIQNLSGC